MNHWKKWMSFLLILALTLSPFAGSLHGFAADGEEQTTEVTEQPREEGNALREATGEETLEIGEEFPATRTPVGAGTPFETLKKQIEDAADGATVTIKAGEYLFPEEIKISGKKIELKVEGGDAVMKRAQGYENAFFTIQEDGGLTLNDGIVIDGEMRECERLSWGGLINNLGKLVINGGVYQNDKTDKQRGRDHVAPIYVHGKTAVLELHGGTIRHNDYSGQTTAYAAGAVMLRFGATMIMDGGTIAENEASTFLWNGQYYSASPGAGGILVEAGCTLTMTGGEISKNIGYGGGVLVGAPEPLPYTESRDKEDETKFKELKLARATFRDGVIKGNEGIGGGGISGHGNVEITIPQGSKLEVSENKAKDGGGIAVMDWAVASIQGRKDLPKVPIETWSKHYAGRLTMAGGTVKNNKARRTGGGIYIATNEATITGGLIDGNRAGDQGGGFYLATIPYTLHMENAYVASNHATNNWGSFTSDGVTLHPKTGGGVWFCPTGTAVFNAEHGALIMTDNEADREADGFFSAQKAKETKDRKYSVTLAERALSGGKIEYYTDGTLVRNGTTPSERIEVKDYTDNLAVKTVLSDGFDEEMVKKLSSLVITNNTASKGGGIGSNGNIIFGTENTISLTVKKIWADGTTPKPVEVEVRAKLGMDNWLIEKIQLNEKNGFTYTLKDLPATVAEQPLQNLLYVKERNADDYKVEISPIVAAEGGKTFAITIKNKKKPTTPTHAQTEVPVTKVWEDADNREMKRPASITVRLYANGKATDKTLVLSAENGWHGSFVGLDKYDVGEEIRYTVEEETTLPEYESVVSGTMEDGFTITNRRKPEKPPIPEKPPVPSIPVYPRVPIIPKAGIGA